jgi:polysaccharide export outer membrane protein
MHTARACRRFAPVCLALLGLAGTGCLGHEQHFAVPEAPVSGLGPPANVPTELNMITLPPYAIGSPDILVIDVYTLPREVLGPATVLSPQPISGQHLVRPDGTVNLGVYGAVSVAGLTTDQAKEAIRRHVYEQLKVLHASSGGRTTVPPDDPAKLYVAVDVIGYNSKAYYVITDGAGFGERIYRFPIQGNETVLDALSNINGLPEVGSKKYVWVARRTPNCNQPDQILPVDYIALTQHGITLTNYQILPGDRVYVRADAEFRIDGWLQKVLTPIERLFGVTLLGSSTVHEIQNKRSSGSGSGF